MSVQAMPKRKKAGTPKLATSNRQRATAQPVHAELAARDARTLRGEFRQTEDCPSGILGRLARIVTLDGSLLDFPKNSGSALAQLSTGEIVMLEPWAGLPQVPILETRRMCPDCQVVCDECTAGMRICTRCGGAGDVLVHGAQARVPCETCAGSKVEKCGRCAGTGKMSIGVHPQDSSFAVGSTVRCQTCAGKGYCFDYKNQDITPFHSGLLEGMVVVPVASLAFVPMGQEDRPGVVISSRDLQGNYMALLIEGNRAWFYGGVARIK